jgi:hypothetical protein
MNRAPVLSAVTTIAAALHALPASKHLAAFAAAPSLTEAWKGFGAATALALLALPQRLQIRIVAAVWRRRHIGLAVSGMLVVVHLVPASDHIPKLLAEITFGDLWRGVGSACAVAWFALPLAMQGRVIGWLRGPHRTRYRSTIGQHHVREST